MFTNDFAARCARHDKYIKGEIFTVLGMTNQDLIKVNRKLVNREW
jgi:hypothetical protein